MISTQMAKLKIMTQLHEKRREEVWDRLFLHMGLPADLLKSFKGDWKQIEAKYEPFKSNNVRAIRNGVYTTGKVPQIVLEIEYIEHVGNCY
jgi:hypothetical protein